MAALSAPLLWWILISVCFFLTSADQRNVTAEPGQTIILPCKLADKNPVIVVQWRRTDLGSEYVFLYRDERIDLGNQHPVYKDRVDLQDRQMKDGDASLVLKNVTTNDTGMYECQVRSEGSRETRRTHLLVSHPDDKDRSNKDGSTGLIVGLIISVVLVLVAAGLFLIYRKQSACFRKKNPDPPADV